MEKKTLIGEKKILCDVLQWLPQILMKRANELCMFDIYQMNWKISGK